MRLLLQDGQKLLRESLRFYLEAQGGITVATCADVTSAAQLVRELRPEIVLLSDSIVEFSRRIKADSATLPVIYLTTTIEPVEVVMLLESGVHGIFLKSNSPSLLVEAIYAVHGGDLWVDPSLQPLSVRRPKLTRREQSVLRAVVDGLSNKEIGGYLGVSEVAVKASLQNIFSKMGVRSRAQLVRLAMESKAAAQ